MKNIKKVTNSKIFRRKCPYTQSFLSYEENVSDILSGIRGAPKINILQKSSLWVNL